MFKSKILRVFTAIAFTFIFLANTVSIFMISAEVEPRQFTAEKPSGVRLGFSRDPSTSMVISWWTAHRDTDSKVFCGKSPLSLNMTVSETNLVSVPTGYIHNVELTNLSPSTKYFYQCGGASGNSSVFNFTTAPSPRSKGVHFAAYGDTRSDRLRRNITANMILTKSLMIFGSETELVLLSGDIVSNGMEQDLFNEFSRDVQPLAAHVPIMYAAGNHEVSGLDSLYPLQYIEPANGNDGWYYSFNWGPVHFITLDTETHGMPIIDAQDLGWLKDDLDRARKDNTILWIVVFFHQPPFVSFSHFSRTDLRESWCALFDEYHVDLVLSGHCHAYQRNYPVSHDGNLDTANDPDYVNPKYPLYIVSGAGAVNEEGTTNSELRNDNFIAKSNNTLFETFDHRVFFPSNNFCNFNVSIDESTNKTRLIMNVIGLNYTAHPQEYNYTVFQVDHASITKAIPGTWYEPSNNMTYPGKPMPLLHGVDLLVFIIGVVAVIDIFILFSCKKAKKSRNN